MNRWAILFLLLVAGCGENTVTRETLNSPRQIRIEITRNKDAKAWLDGPFVELDPKVSGSDLYDLRLTWLVASEFRHETYWYDAASGLETRRIAETPEPSLEFPIQDSEQRGHVHEEKLRWGQVYSYEIRVHRWKTAKTTPKPDVVEWLFRVRIDLKNPPPPTTAAPAAPAAY